MKRASFSIGILALLSATVSIGVARAYDASSTDFFVRQNVLSVGGTSTSAFSTSSDFKLVGAGGETGTGTSTSADFWLLGGFLRSLYKGPAPSYEQIHYHWRNDNGSESGATSGTSGTQDTATSSVPTGAIKRLRIEIANHGGTILNYKAQQFGLQYATLSSTCGAIPSSGWANVGSVGSTGTEWSMANSSNLTNGGNTTNIDSAHGGVTDANHTFLASNGGVVNNTSTTTSAVSVPSDSFIELEYAIIATTASQGGATYCFRAENASSTSNFLYTVYPQATLVNSTSLTFVMDSSSETLPNISPGTLVATTSIMTITTTNAHGFSVTANRNNSSATMLLNTDPSVSIPDQTAWSPGSTCSNAGNGSASTTNPNTLQFRIRQSGTDSSNYCSAWWGTDDTTSNARFGGFPTSAQQIINRSTASSPATKAIVLYNLNVAATQKNGAYSGGVTYTATVNP